VVSGGIPRNASLPPSSMTNTSIGRLSNQLIRLAPLEVVSPLTPAFTTRNGYPFWSTKL